MDIFRWIKREWDTTQSCRRRDSEPVAPVSVHHFNLSQSRDEAYLRALKKFNEWRHKERSGSFRRLSRRISRKSSIKSYTERTTATVTVPIAADSNSTMMMMKEAKTPEEDNHEESHLYEELRIPRRPKPKNLFDSAKKLLQKSQSFPTNISNCNNSINNNNIVQAENTVNVLKSCQKCPVISENDEIDEFENNHCISVRQIDLENVQKQSTPPKTFFRDNSNPFTGVRSPIRANRYNLTSFNDPKRLFNYTDDSIDQFVRPSLPKDRDMLVSDKQHLSENSIGRSSNKSTKKYEFNSSAIYENDGKLNRLSQSPMYQTVINKHGDLVEYAIPFNDQNDEEFGQINELKNRSSQLKQVIGDDHLIASTFPLIEVNDSSKSRRTSKSLCDLNIYAEIRKKRGNIIVTDLDKSDEITKCNKAPLIEDDIIDELESLENWSRRLTDELGIQSCVTDEIKTTSNLIICSPVDISQRISTLRNTMSGPPILLSSGNFRKTSVSLRKVEKRFRIQSEQGLLHDLYILNKIKHPNVTLLMAVCLDVNNKILSIVLEPFITNINGMIYDSDYKISMEDCIEYILQVIKAVIYLHENDIIHTNICSHNVLVCENKKVVKLSSFELATEVDLFKTQNNIIYTFYGSLENFQKSILKSNITEEGWSSLISKNKIPSQYLPYLIEYRKLYSEHYYQPPELLSSVKHFVFPSKQADVYSIALLLWEMLNSCVPFAIFSYEEIENLFQLNDTNQLPLFDGDRCELFESLLQNGLITLPNSRIENVQSMKFLVDEAKVHLKVNESVETTHSRIVNKSTHRAEKCSREKYVTNESFSPIRTECRRTSTFKKDNTTPVDDKRANFVPKHINSQPNPNNYSSRSLDDILREDRRNETRKEYGFQIEDFSLPSTPIARKNKLRRNAWLSNKTLNQKSFDESEEDALEKLNNENDSRNDVKNKLINVNIKIIQNKIDKETTSGSPPDKQKSPDDIANVSSQIDYWNSIVSPGDISLKKRNNTELSSSNADSETMKTPDSRIENTSPYEQSTPLIRDHEKSNTKEFMSPRSATPRSSQRSSIVRKALKDRAKYYPNMPELLSETFLRRSNKNENDFENTLWKREKERCERISPTHSERFNDGTDGVIRPLRASVKDTVHKFESFVRRGNNTSIRSSNEKLLHVNNYDASTIFGRSLFNAVVNQSQNDNHNQSLPTVITDTNVSFRNADSTTPDENISISKLDVNLKNIKPQATTAKLLHPSNIASSSSTTETVQKISRLTIPTLCMKATVDNNHQDQVKPLLTNSSIRKSKPTLFSINIRKLNRRASDIGCVRKLAKRENSLRHSICGTDLVRSVAKMNIKSKQSTNCENLLLQKSAKSVTSLAESDIQHCKLSCWKCGSKVFKLDEIAFNEKAVRTKRFLRRFSTSPIPSTNNLDTTQRIFPTMSVEEMKSIEDLYIDDDFGGGQESLGANMRLLSPDHDDLFDILSIDFLSTDFLENIE